VYDDREEADAVRMLHAGRGSARTTMERGDWARYNAGAPSAANLHQVRTFSATFPGSRPHPETGKKDVSLPFGRVLDPA